MHADVFGEWCDAQEKSHVISVESVFNLSTNVEIPTVRFQSLKEWEGNYVRHFWVTGCVSGLGGEGVRAWLVGLSQNSHVISVESVFNLSTNVAIPMARFQSLKEWEGNYVRHFWVTGRRGEAGGQQR